MSAFQQAFSKWMEKLRQPGAIAEMLDNRKELIPSVPVELDVFYGCRLALALGEPWLAGSWRKEMQNISLEWRSKRDPMHMQLADDRSISIASLSSPLTTAACSRSMKACCTKPSPISGPGSLGNSEKDHAALRRDPVADAAAAIAQLS